MKKETLKASEKMEKVFNLAIVELEKILDGKKAVTDLSKIAATSMGVYTKLVSTELHSHVLKFAIMKDISKDRAELKKFISVATPELNPVKMLK